MHRQDQRNSIWLLAFLLMLAGCGTSASRESTVIKTLTEVGENAPYRNVLIISVAGDFPDRVRFEQDLTGRLSSDESAATAFYTVVGRRAQLTRKVLSTVLIAREFDAVILARLKGQDQPDLVFGRPTGHGFDLFLYDYEELNLPVTIRTGSTVSFVVEVYDADASKKIWAIESLLFDTVSVDSVISDQVAAIGAEIVRDGLVSL